MRDGPSRLYLRVSCSFTVLSSGGASAAMSYSICGSLVIVPGKKSSHLGDAVDPKS